MKVGWTSALVVAVAAVAGCASSTPAGITGPHGEPSAAPPSGSAPAGRDEVIDGGALIIGAAPKHASPISRATAEWYLAHTAGSAPSRAGAPRYATVTLKAGADSPALDHVAAWVLPYAPLPHSCPAQLATPGEPTPSAGYFHTTFSALIIPDDLRGITYGGIGTGCNNPEPFINLAMLQESVPFTVVGGTDADSSGTASIELPCGAKVAGASSTGHSGGPMEVQVMVSVPMGPCEGAAKPTTAPIPTGAITHGPVGFADAGYGEPTAGAPTATPAP